ncbi:MAG: YicC/YloC family endoribonuclease, partial [Bacteroidota bacterium]
MGGKWDALEGQSVFCLLFWRLKKVGPAAGDVALVKRRPGHDNKYSMILSMTGYGAGIASSDSFRVTAELKSLNSKYLEVTLKLPKVYLKYEHEIRSMLGKRLGRGKVVALLNIEVLTDKVQRININRALAKSYLKELNSIKDELNLAGDIDLSFLVNMPEVIPTDMGEENEEEWNLIRQAIELAC